MSSGLRIRLFGGFGLEYDGAEVPGLNAARLQSLLAYLLLQDQGALSRQHVAFLFWPDVSEDQARNNLRQALHQLRRALPTGDSFLHADASTVHWRWDSPTWLDVIEFKAALATAQAAAQRGQVVAQRAPGTAWPRGELLPSCYDDWIALERERLHQDCLEALESLTGLLEGQRAYAAAIPSARRLVQHDRLHENGYRLLMRLCALNGDRADALRVYHACADTLQRELGVEPEDETQALYRRLLHTGDHPPVDELPRLMSAPPLVGRENAWSELRSLWRQVSSGSPHFVLIEGDAGIGKTRLAEEFGEWAARQGISTARTRAYAAEGTMSYGPLVDWLRSEICRPVLASMEAVWRSEIARLLPELLVETPDLPRPEPLVEHWQRQRFHEALARSVARNSRCSCCWTICSGRP
jgi:DNA-binding SARP family transcriptional activator